MRLAAEGNPHPLQGEKLVLPMHGPVWAQVVLPLNTPDERYVNYLFNEALGRPVSHQPTLNFFTSGLQSQSRSTIAQSILRSTEGRTKLVIDVFQPSMHQVLNPVEANSSLPFVTPHSGSEFVFKFFIQGSEQYFAQAGGQNTTFVTRIFTEDLHRTPDAANLNFWSSHLTLGDITRAQVAQSIGTSSEGLVNFVDDVVFDYLGRHASPGEFTPFVNALQTQTVSPASFRAIVLGSDEAFAHAQLASVPEPSTYGIFTALALTGFALFRRFAHRSQNG